MVKNAADQPLAYFHVPTPEGFPTDDILRVAEIVPDYPDEPGFLPSLSACATGVTQVIDESWTYKFVRKGVLRRPEVDNVVMTPYQQQEEMQRLSPDDPARRVARYFITSIGESRPITDPFQVRAMLRMEMYTPTWPIPGNLHREPYPNITDLEVRNGVLTEGTYKFDALALMRTALKGMHPGHRIAADTERQNPDGIRFLKALGFKDHNRGQKVTVGVRPGSADGPAQHVGITYTRMQAPKAVEVQDTLRRWVDRFIPQ